MNNNLKVAISPSRPGVNDMLLFTSIWDINRIKSGSHERGNNGLRQIIIE